jgi:DNA processing protein
LQWACRCSAEGQPEAEARALLSAADRALAHAARLGHQAVGLDAPGYPALLREIADPPPVLWVRGSAEALTAPRMVAVVGARAATRAGLAVATDLAAGLAVAGVTVVSGLARGVDGAAHHAAVAQGGRSIGVLGSGLDRLYPSEHEPLAEAMTVHGAVVSEHLADTPALAYHFPLRNRIISGLASAVVVVEASEKSGSLITAMAALEQGREVMAGPGRHRGGHALLRDGARLVESADDVLAELGWAQRVAAGPAAARLAPDLAAELGLEPTVEDFSTDEVAAATGRPIAAISARLGALEVEGRIQRIGGGRFMGGRNRVLT